MSNIKTWLIRGDTHGRTSWITEQLRDYQPEQTAIIILGDAGFNFFLNKKDQHTKEYIESFGYYIYAVRGNHEMRPEHLENIEYIYDANVHGDVMYERNYPHIRYFKNYGIYNINGYRCLIIGGAYSVDKWYRLSRAGIKTPEMNIPSKTGWFYDECLSVIEMASCEQMIKDTRDNYFDFVFTHTCPKKYQPTDLFLGFVDQSTVDMSMEVWMDKISEQIQFHCWCFGHYHADRVERPYIEQYFNDIENIKVIWERWAHYDETGELDWWLHKSPNFYVNDK